MFNVSGVFGGRLVLLRTVQQCLVSLWGGEGTESLSKPDDALVMSLGLSWLFKEKPASNAGGTGSERSGHVGGKEGSHKGETELHCGKPGVKCFWWLV